jgi:uncharacterized alkaline shock family protein YloU
MIRIENASGAITITNEVFTVLAGDAATSCFGVKGMAMRSVSDGLVHLLKREVQYKGVYVTYGEDASVSVELHIIVDRDVNIPVICKSMMSEIRYRIREATGIDLKTIDIFVDSIQIG